jgi:integrase
LAYLEFAEGYYVKNGKPTSRLINVKLAIRYLREHYGRTLAVDFGPLALQTMQRILAEKRLTRKTVDTLVGIYKAMFRWANNQEMIPPHVYQALQPVGGLKMGRTPARESQPVRPVDPQIVEQTLPYLTAVVADMVRFQLLTAVRPQEVYNLRPCDKRYCNRYAF